MASWTLLKIGCHRPPELSFLVMGIERYVFIHFTLMSLSHGMCKWWVVKKERKEFFSQEVGDLELIIFVSFVEHFCHFSTYCGPCH